MIIIEVKKCQLASLVTKVINASKPVGAGFIHYVNKNYTEDEIKGVLRLPWENPSVKDIHVDYFGGRMVKLNMWYKKEDEDKNYYEVRPDLDIEYQSWCSKYKTWEDLLIDVSL